MDNGVSDMAQVLNVTATYFEMSAKLTKESFNLLKNFSMLVLHAIKYGVNKNIENSKGKVGINRMKSLTNNYAYARTSKNKDIEKEFIKLCKQHGIPVTKCKGVKDSGEYHWIYPSEFAPVMESVMEYMQEYAAKKFEKDGMSKEDAEKKAKSENRTESENEIAKDLGCELPPAEFQKEFFKTVATPEEKEYYKQLEKKKPQISESKKSELKNAIKRNTNRNKSKRFEREGLYTVTFSKDQIVGTVTKDNQRFVKVRFEKDFGQAFLVNEKYMTKVGDKFQGAFSKDGNITTYNLRDNSERTMKFSEFLKENQSTRAASKTTARSKSENKTATPLPDKKPKTKGNKL